MKVRVHVSGLNEIKTALHALPASTAKGVLRRVLKRRAKPVAATARANVPVASGYLKGTIAVSTKLSRRQRRLHKKPTRDTVEVFVGAGTDPAAHIQEFGTAKNKPQPFLRPAWDRNKASILRGVRDDLWHEIRKTIKRKARAASRVRR